MKKSIQILATIAMLFATATAQGQTWGTSGTNATCTNGSATRLVVKQDGTVWVGDGSGTQKSTATLFYVDGSMNAREIIVNLKNWPDYVFDSTYTLLPLDSVQIFIDSAHHLPNVPSASQVSQNGVELGSMNAILLRKLEEMQLYILELNARIKELELEKAKTN